LNPWINVRKSLPKTGEENQLVLLNHSAHGARFGYIYILECPGIIEELEEEFLDASTSSSPKYRKISEKNPKTSQKKRKTLGKTKINF